MCWSFHGRSEIGDEFEKNKLSEEWFEQNEYISSPILELSFIFNFRICHENTNTPLDGAYLADFSIHISIALILMMSTHASRIKPTLIVKTSFSSIQDAKWPTARFVLFVHFVCGLSFFCVYDNLHSAVVSSGFSIDGFEILFLPTKPQKPNGKFKYCYLLLKNWRVWEPSSKNWRVWPNPSNPFWRQRWY